MNFILNIFGYVFDLGRNLLERALGYFLDLNIFEKIIVLNTLTAFFAAMLPAGEYVIWDGVDELNNPIAPYLVGLVMLMFVTMHFRHLISLIVRVVINFYYLFWAVFIHYNDDIAVRATCPYELTIGYYINIIVPVVYIACAIFSHLTEDY